ncbi:MAG: LPS-assembly protein LptD, partial [Bdellovibrionales bacterium]|nr:LPS-assembly protein LptD [Bdellovibrionales bacterium]
IQAQGDTGNVNMKTKDISLNGSVVITSPESTIEAQQAEMNLDTEVGSFEDASFTLEEGAYSADAEQAEKLNDFDFKLTDCILSTCHCEDGDTPWKISGTRANLEREGYAHVYNATFKMWDVPILYTPWIAFPVKQERSSGLLVPEFGYSSRDGLKLRLPTYLVLDESSDATITPFTETHTRNGLQLDYRRAYSTKSSVDGRMVYSNETPRDGNLRGTDVTDIAEPDIDDNRFGGYLLQSWRNESSSDIPVSVVTDAHWVSDTLFLREMDDPDIGLASSRYATSRMAMRAGLSDYVSTSLVGEWNEAITSPQDGVFQRLPEFTLNALKSYRPFGFNPYGLKVTPRLQVQAVEFQRKEGFDGVRYDVSPSLKIPFHYKNYFNSEFSFEFHQTQYELNELYNPLTASELESGTDRSLWKFSYQVGTAVERIYDLPEDNILTTLTSLGSGNQQYRLERVKHTIEPRLILDYVPGTSQDHLPLFDSFDRIRRRSLATYDVTTRLVGSSGYLQGQSGDIEEFVDSADTYSALDTLNPLTDYDSDWGLRADTFGTPMQLPPRRGRAIRDLASLRFVQSYDYVEDQQDLDPTREAFSDLGVQLGLSPTEDFGLMASSTVDVETSDVSSWSLASHIYDDRGDRFRARYTYIDQQVGQLEGNVEVPLSSRLRLGYYTRYDDQEGEFIEQQAALRISSKCNCWHFDIGVSDEINPDRQRVLFRVTLAGLGDLTQDIGFDDRRKENS